MYVPPQISKINNLFSDSAFKIYLTGGAIRDNLLGYKPLNYDFITTAASHQIKYILTKNNIKHHNMKSFIGVNIDNIYIKISTLKTDILEDSKKRDLTFNAMYYDINNQQLIDYHGGKSDLEKRTIRPIGDVNVTFQDNNIIILRIIRYTCKYNLYIDPRLFRIMKATKINNLKSEETYYELKKSFNPKTFNRYIKMLYLMELFVYIFKEFENIQYDVKTNINVKNLGEGLAILFKKEDNIKNKMIKSKYDSLLIDEVMKYLI
jgi:poly(A) polymerase